MKTTSIKNWEIGKTPSALESIHQQDVNIAIYERDTSKLKAEIDSLLEQNIERRAKGDIDTILGEITQAIKPEKHSLIIEDIKALLHLFQEVSQAKSIRLLLATVNVNMCRKFHTDVNDMRMLCTYSGPGTLWLKEDNINRDAMNAAGLNEAIVLDQDKIQQVETGAAILLKGALYPKEGTRAVVHRSPTIEESGQKRLLLRIDTHEFMTF